MCQQISLMLRGIKEKGIFLLLGGGLGLGIGSYAWRAGEAIKRNEGCSSQKGREGFTFHFPEEGYTSTEQPPLPLQYQQGLWETSVSKVFQISMFWDLIELIWKYTHCVLGSPGGPGKPQEPDTWMFLNIDSMIKNCRLTLVRLGFATKLIWWQANKKCLALRVFFRIMDKEVWICW